MGNKWTVDSNGNLDLLGTIKDTSLVNSIDTNSRFLYSPSTVTTVQWGNCFLIDLSFIKCMDWNLRTAYDSSLRSAIMWEVRWLRDNSNVTSIDWQARVMYSNSGAPNLAYGTDNVLNASTSALQIGALQVVEGTADAKQGTATLVAGIANVSTTAVTANSRIFLTAQDNNSVGALRVFSRTPGSSFFIISSIGTDSGLVAWEIFEPA